MGPGDVLGRRALNRATLHRQRLLGRGGETAETIEHLVGMQAQNPLDPYFALWSRVPGFETEDLRRLLLDRQAVRSPLLRGTIHLVTSRDYLTLQPLFQTVLERIFRSTAFAKDTAAVVEGDLLDFSAKLLRAEPMMRAQLGRVLEERFPGYPPASLAQRATYLLAVVQITPRGLWGSTGSATWAIGEDWLGRSLDVAGSVDDLVIRYLGAFGPASISDMRIWSGLAGLREVFDRLAHRLRIWSSDGGTELFDLPDAHHPDPETPAPPRFLPEYDNVLLGHADRSRFFDHAVPLGWVGNLLIDGIYSGSWKVVADKRVRRLIVTLQIPASDVGKSEIEAEGTRLLGLWQDDGRDRSVEFDTADNS